MRFPFWWLPSWRHRVQLEAKIDRLLSQQETAQRQLIRAVERMTDVAAAQTKVFETWVGLFKDQHTQPTRRWTRDIAQENQEFLAQRGMPENLSETEQAEWVKAELGIT